jgi:hypothetical protein
MNRHLAKEQQKKIAAIVIARNKKNIGGKEITTPIVVHEILSRHLEPTAPRAVTY